MSAETENQIIVNQKNDRKFRFFYWISGAVGFISGMIAIFNFGSARYKDAQYFVIREIRKNSFDTNVFIQYKHETDIKLSRIDSNQTEILKKLNQKK
jgi:hypothetical protein